MRMGRVLNKLGSKKSIVTPRSANKIEVPAKVNATGYPNSRAEQIKTIKYSEEKFPDDKHCPISFIDFKQGEHICQLPCGHIFHKDSILQWLEKEQARCPVCRHELSSKEIKNEDISQNIISSRPYPRQSFSQLFRNVILEREQRADDEALQRAILESLNDT